MQVPLHQGHARPSSMTAQLQPLLTKIAQQQLALTTLSWQMPTFALPLMLQLRLHLLSANGPARGVNPPPHLSLLPLVEPQMCRASVTATPGSVSQPLQPSCLPPVTAMPEPSCHSRDNYAQHGVLEFSQLLKSNPRKFWQMVRLPSMVLPE